MSRGSMDELESDANESPRGDAAGRFVTTHVGEVEPRGAPYFCNIIFLCCTNPAAWIL